MGGKKKGVSDFRYDTGAAKVPWAAVGELVDLEQITEVLRFLMPEREGKAAEYRRRFGEAEQALRRLAEASSYAGKLTLGNRVKELEAASNAFLKSKHSVFLTNATAGFEIAFRYAGLKPGDEVIAPAITFIATILYPLEVGAKVVLADVDPRTLNMDPADVARKVTKKTKAIIPVHLGGYPVDMAPIMKLARERKITVVEDAAHAFGASYRGKMIGTVGHFGAFSFHEVKNVTSFGEGGLLTTDLPFGKDFALARFVGLDPTKKIPTWLYDVRTLKGAEGPFVPSNHSATEIQALVLLLQMKRIRKIIEIRRRHAAYLTKRFAGEPAIIPQLMDTKDAKSTYHLYLLQLDPLKLKGDIQEFKERIAAKGVVQIPHFAPLYKFSMMRQLGYDTAAIEKSCPVAEEAFRRRFTHLPLYPLTDEQVAYMADAVLETVAEMKRR